MVNATNPSMANYLNGTTPAMLGLPTMSNAANPYGVWPHSAVVQGASTTDQQHANPAAGNAGLQALDWEGMEDFEVDADHST